MTGEERRIALLNTIREANAPISGTSLAKIYHVSRQIIVQDIALLRTQHPEIQATPRGYVMLHASAADSSEVSEKHTISNSKQTIHKSNGMVQRVYCVTHTDEQIEDELNTIVDMGGIVLDVYVEHKIYGAIRADLTMKCRRHVQEFMEGKMVFTTATSDVIKKLDAAKEEGTFTFEYGLVPIPALTEELDTRNISVTNTIVVNGFSDSKEDANRFASYLVGEEIASLYEKTGKLPAASAAACRDDKTAVFYQEYEESVPVPKMMETSNLWVQMEVTFAEVWNGANVSKSLQELSELIMSQITDTDYKEDYIEEPTKEEETVEYLDEEALREEAMQE